MKQSIQEYNQRPIRYLGLWEIGGLKLKAYGITCGQIRLEQKLIDAALRVAQERIAASARNTNHYGVGFVGIHQGETGDFVFVDWWADENELHHHVYVSPSGKPDDLEYKTPTGLSACVWDLYLIGHERDAWVNHVLKKNRAPDLDGYLNEILNDDV